MLEVVPREYELTVNNWKGPLLALGSKGRKIWWNFLNDPRVPTKVKSKFLAALKKKFNPQSPDSKFSDPMEVIDECISPDMVMHGPKPVDKVPGELAHIMSLDWFKRLLADNGALKPHEAEEIIFKQIDTGKLGDLYPKERVCNRKAFLWVGDAEVMRKIYRNEGADELRDRLGLSHFGKGEKILVMVFSREAVEGSNPSGKSKKFAIPTVMEGGKGHAFTPAVRTEKRSGHTIHLKTGKRTEREWVCRGVKKAHVSFDKDFIATRSNMLLKTGPSRGFLKKFDFSAL